MTIKKYFIPRDRRIFLFTMLFFFLLILIHGFYFERYLVFLETLFSGAITGIPLADFQTIAYVGLIVISAKLYQLFPNVAWLDYSTIGIAMITAVLYLWGIAQLTIKRGMGFVLGLIVTLCATPLVYFNLASANNSREAFLFPMLMLFVFWGWSSAKPCYRYLFTLFIFCIIMLIRVEFGYLAVVVFGGFALLQWRWFIKQWRWFIAPFTFCMLIGSYLYIDRNYSGDFAKESDFSQYLISDATNVEIFNHFEDPKDSLRYLAAKELWLSDTANLKIEFFRSLQQYKVGLSTSYFRDYFPIYFTKGIDMLRFFLNDDLPFLILPLLLWLYFMAESWLVVGDIKKRWAILTIPFLWILFLLLAICYLVRMETTVLQPFLLIATLFLLATHNSTVSAHRINRARFLKVLLLLPLIFLFFWANSHLSSFTKQKEKILTLCQKVSAEADSIARGKYLMLDGYSTLIFDHKPGKNFVFKQPKKILLYDCGQLILGHQYLEYYSEICQCNPLDNASFYSFLLAHKDELLLLSNPQRNAFIKTYLYGMHQMDIDFVKVPGDFEAEKLKDFGIEIHYYTIRNSSEGK